MALQETLASIAQSGLPLQDKLDALKAAGLERSTTVIVTADHGFARANRVLEPNVLLRRAGLLELDAAHRIVRARAQVVPEGGTGMVYLTEPATRDTDRQRVVALFRGQEGIAAVLTPDQYPARGLPPPGPHNGMPDLVLGAKDGYAIGGAAAGDDFVVAATMNTDQGYHGYLAENPRMNAAFVAAGRGLRRGVRVGVLDNVDVAPTIAYLLGVRMPNVEGKVLDQILTAPPTATDWGR